MTDFCAPDCYAAMRLCALAGVALGAWFGWMWDRRKR